MAPIYLGKRVLPSSFRYIENLAPGRLVLCRISDSRGLVVIWLWWDNEQMRSVEKLHSETRRAVEGV